MQAMNPRERALHFLKQMLGPEADFRPGQWEAIEHVVTRKQRILVVQRTGWGKSLVYFISTRLLREQGHGPTLLISPLLSLMRNQLEMAEKIGVRAKSINSTNREDWHEIETQITEGQCDLLLVSPERLSNEHFVKDLLPNAIRTVGLFVVDEAHCISDWGHDFRPDYRRIVNVLKLLPQGTPVLGTTATANNRVIEDIQTQLQPNLRILRGPLTRESLRLQALRIPDQSKRLAWLAKNLEKFKGSGIVYCLTTRDTETVASWLRSQNFSAAAYHANLPSADREELENDFLANEIQILVATVALGMGFDKPDIEFVVHYQSPGSVVAYYQQVGRAGRSLHKAYGILLTGEEDEQIARYFIESAFPSEKIMRGILHALEAEKSLGEKEILDRVNTTPTVMKKALKLLEIDGAIGTEQKGGNRYFRTPRSWKPDSERITHVTEQRYAEWQQMQEYVSHRECLMEYLQMALDDEHPQPCGRCANCVGQGFSAETDRVYSDAATAFLQNTPIVIQPRKQWIIPIENGQKSSIPAEMRIEEGRALSYYGSGKWGKLVRDGKYEVGRFDDRLVEAASKLLETTWDPSSRPSWVTAIPSLRHPELVPDFARRLANQLKLPFHQVLLRTRNAPEQKTMRNSAMQSRNVHDTMSIGLPVPAGRVLLVDDIVDSRWTMTVAGYLLRLHGSGPVLPFALAMATSRDAEAS